MSTRRRSIAWTVATFAACGLALSAHAARDPMRPPLPAAGPAAARIAPVPALTAVIGSDERRVAIVNGRVVREGDTIDGLLILAVLEGGIRYSRAGTVRELLLPSTPAMKRPARTPSGGSGSGR